MLIGNLHFYRTPLILPSQSPAEVRMSRATATDQCFSLLRLFPSLSSPPPLSLPLPRRFRFYAPDSATDSSPPSSWNDRAACYTIANYCTLAHTPAICQLWPVWHKILTSYPFSLYSDRVFRNSGSQEFVNVEDLDDKLGPGFGNFADQADAMDVVPPEHQNLLLSLSRKGIEVAVENGWPFLFKEAADTIGTMKLFLSGSSPDVLGYEKPSMVDLMKFFLSYASVPLFSLVLYSLFSTERYTPQRTRFCKQQRGRMKGISSSGNHICFGRYAIQALEPAWITSRQIEAGRRAMTRYAGRDGKLWVRIFPDKPVTTRPAETRMGKGKGSPMYWVAVVKPGRILYELSGVTEKIAREAISIAASKMPIRTQFLISE